MTQAHTFILSMEERFDTESAPYGNRFEVISFDGNIRAELDGANYCASYRGVKNGGRVFTFSDGSRVNVSADGTRVYEVARH